MNPVRKAFEKIPFRNKTIEELKAVSGLDGAVLSSESTIHFPNVFGSFTSSGRKFQTCLTLVGIDGCNNKKVLNDSCRAFNVLDKKEIDADTTLLEFKIFMSTGHCPNFTGECIDSGSQAHLSYCFMSKDRTHLFATEYLCLFRFFIETLIHAYRDRDLKIIDNPVREFIHPTEKEVQDLICPYDAILVLINSYNKKAPEGRKINSHEPFLDLDTGRKRKALYSYYMEAIKQLRVDPEMIEAATVEILAIDWPTSK